MRQEFRDRVILPVLIPLGLMSVIGVVAVGFGMMLLYTPMMVAGTIAIVVAAGILTAVALATAHDELPRLKAAVITGAGVVPLALGGLVATDVISTTSEKVSEREPHHGVPAGAVELVAANVAWEQQTLALPAEGEVAIVLVNNDDGIPHNVSVYPLAGPEPDLENPVFVGQNVTGVAQLVNEFEAPEEPGEYYFQCDVHPNMQGTAVFEGEGGAEQAQH